MHVCCNACVLQRQVCSHSLLRTSALLCCALSPAPEMYAGCLGVSAQGCRHPRRCAVVRLSARRARQAGHIWLWPARCERTRSMSTTAECRAHGAQSDRQGWASGGAGRVHSLARVDTDQKTGSRAGESSCDAEGGYAGQVLICVRSVLAVRARLCKGVADAEHTGPESACGGPCAGLWSASCGAT